MAFKLYTFLILSFTLANSFVIDEKTNQRSFVLEPQYHGSSYILDSSNFVEESFPSGEYSDYSGLNKPSESEPSESEEDVTTVPTTIPTTTEEIHTTSPPVRICPENQSYYVDSDLNKMINHFASTMNLIENLNGSYYGLTVELRDKNLKSLNDFMTKFENRPRHVDHIIEDLARTRTGTLEPLVKELLSKRPEFALLSQAHDQHVANSKVPMERFIKTKKLCELNCDLEPKTIYKRSISVRRTAQGLYYCGTIQEVRDTINSVLKDFQDNYAESLRDSVVATHIHHEEVIEQLKSKLKEAAVKEFGATMYDVLSLEDEYNHFLKLLKGDNGIDNVEFQLGEIRKNNLQIEFKIDQLKSDVQKYRKYCLACDSNHSIRRRRDVEPSGEILDNLLDNFINKAKADFESDQADLFEELNVKLSDQDTFIQDALAKLQPLKDHIKENLEKEEAELNELKSREPEALIEDLAKLKDDTSKFDKQLEDALNFIHNIIQ